MKAFIVLALCCSLFSSKAIPLEFEFSDCDDPDVFKAVDAALKKYNEDEATGTQFALYVVMEAKRTFYVKYRILESTCASEENKHWQHCHYRVSAEAVSICSCSLPDRKNENLRLFCIKPYVFWFVAFPDVSKIRLTEAPCLGCFHPISSDGSEVSEILKKAIQKFNKHSDEPALFKLAEIKEAKRQVVAGWNYVIRYQIEETNCTKDQFQDLTPECKITSRGPLSTLNLLFLRSETCCSLSVEETVVAAICPGCPRTIPTDSPELKELLKVSTEKYNSESDDDFYYKGGEIQSATVQVVAGKKYRVKFTVWKTNCSKSEFEKLNEDCTATSDSASLSCDAQIHVIPWQNKIYPQVNCSEEHQAVRFFFSIHPIKQSVGQRQSINSLSIPNYPIFYTKNTGTQFF
uniref:Cystatin kininogen-type domain-containing protein n=1 Tax=Junco hyemalis TaxID=40217 RepID=A0A8C5IY63_JUNHY